MAEVDDATAADIQGVDSRAYRRHARFARAMFEGFTVRLFQYSAFYFVTKHLWHADGAWPGPGTAAAKDSVG